MRVLSLIHQAEGPSGVFADAVAEAGHELVEWNMGQRQRLPDEDFPAVLVFGGAMHVDEEDRHPWLRHEHAFLAELVARDVPVLGVCLGGQLLAKAVGASVRRLPTPEIGWFPVTLTDEARADPVLGGLPRRFDSLQWHSYAFELPDGGVLLARNDRCDQAFRVGEAAWGLQFHAEVTRRTLHAWIASPRTGEDDGIDRAALRARTDGRIRRWNELGKTICGRFLAVAESRGATAGAATTRATSPRS